MWPTADASFDAFISLADYVIVLEEASMCMICVEVPQANQMHQVL